MVIELKLRWNLGAAFSTSDLAPTGHLITVKQVWNLGAPVLGHVGSDLAPVSFKLAVQLVGSPERDLHHWSNWI